MDHHHLDDKTIIKNAAKSVLCSDGEVWVKKSAGENEPPFDVTMGGYHGAEICELVGLYMLEGLKEIIPNGQVGLYRDDGLAAVPITSGTKTEAIKKKLHQFAKRVGLKLEIENPAFATDFLDLNFNLKSHSFGPYRKPNSRLSYINARSNHPPTIIKEIPSMIEYRISKRSCNKDEFNKAADDYNEALRNCGYTKRIEYKEEEKECGEKRKKKNRKRKLIWFNPPFSRNVKTNIGKIFINLVKKHFGTKNPLSKIINKKNMKISYSCMENIKSIIKKHNKKILESNRKEEIPPCNCRNKNN